MRTFPASGSSPRLARCARNSETDLMDELPVLRVLRVLRVCLSRRVADALVVTLAAPPALAPLIQHVKRATSPRRIVHVESLRRVEQTPALISRSIR
jgi:hypothetical protein